jgi:hypothetical protein
MKKEEFLSINLKERHPCGGINLCKCNTSERRMLHGRFKKHFEKKYLTKRYYDKKMKEFFELKLGSMTIDEYERRFLELLKYVSFIKDETVNIHRYLSGIPSFISEKIQYDDPKTWRKP